MNTIKGLYKKYEEVILYLIFGVLTTIISVVLYWILGLIFPLQESGVVNSACVIFKNIVAILFAYVTNRKFVFRSRVHGFGPVMLEMLNFFAARLATLVFEIVFMTVTVNMLGFNKDISLGGFTVNQSLIMNVIAQFVIVVLNYVFSKLWIFKKK